MFTSRRSNTVAPASNDIELNTIQYKATQYRRNERNAQENKRRRLKRNKISPADGERTRDVTNQSIRNSRCVTDNHLASQR